MGQSYFDANMEDANVFVELQLSGKTYEVERFSTSLRQDTSVKNLEPKSEVEGGVLEITLVQVPDNALLQWAASKWIRKDGEVVFKNESATPVMRVSFKEGACVNFSQSCSQGIGSCVVLTISAKEITINGFVLAKNWEE